MFSFKKNHQLRKIILTLVTLQCNTLSTQISQASNIIQLTSSFLCSFSTQVFYRHLGNIVAFWNCNVVDGSDFMALTLLMLFKTFEDFFYDLNHFVMFVVYLFLSVTKVPFLSCVKQFRKNTISVLKLSCREVSDYVFLCYTLNGRYFTFLL